MIGVIQACALWDYHLLRKFGFAAFAIGALRLMGGFRTAQLATQGERAKMRWALFLIRERNCRKGLLAKADIGRERWHGGSLKASNPRQGEGVLCPQESRE
jgi:hypothetical protein